MLYCCFHPRVLLLVILEDLFITVGPGGTEPWRWGWVILPSRHPRRDRWVRVANAGCSHRCPRAEGALQEGEVPARRLVPQLHRGEGALAPAPWRCQQDPASRGRPVPVSAHSAVGVQGRGSSGPVSVIFGK